MSHIPETESSTRQMLDDAHAYPPGLRQAIGFERIVSLDRQAGTAIIQFNARPEFAHTGGTIVQGGFITAWLDNAMAFAVMARGAASVASLEIKVSFLARVSPGTVTAHARVVRMGRSIVFLEATLVSADGELLATASSSGKLILKA